MPLHSVRTGRSIAAWINNNELPMISDPSFAYYGNFLPGVAVPTPIFIAVICMILAWALLRFTNIGLYSQAVGINASAARLNGIHPQFVKFLTYVILGLCVAVAGFIKVSRFSTINYSVVAKDIEMDEGLPDRRAGEPADRRCAAAYGRPSKMHCLREMP